MDAAGLITPITLKSYYNLDADQIKDNGFYLNMNTMKNVPTAYGTILSLVASSATHHVQLYFPAQGTNAIYYRQFQSGAWTSWSSVSFS